MNTRISTSGLPDYVGREGELSIRQPYQSLETQSYIFVLPAAPAQLQNLCDRYLNKPSGGAVSYTPLLPFVYVFLNHYPRFKSIPEQDKGFLRYSEVVFGFPAVNRKAVQLPFQTNTEGFLGDLVDDIEKLIDNIEDIFNGSALFIPFIFVDDSIALLSGQEIYGYPKQWGWIEMPTGPEFSTSFNLDVATWQTLGADKPITRQRIVRITNRTQTHEHRTVTNLADSKGERESLRAQLLQRVRQYTHSLNPLSRLEGETLMDKRIDCLLVHLQHLFFRSYENVFLKEFRDITDGTKSCYQAVVKAPFEGIKMHQFQLLFDQFVVEIPKLEGMPIQKQLGLISRDQSDQFIPWISCRLVFDFQLVKGNVLWQAGRSAPMPFWQYPFKRLRRYFQGQ